MLWDPAKNLIIFQGAERRLKKSKSSNYSAPFLDNVIQCDIVIIIHDGEIRAVVLQEGITFLYIIFRVGEALWMSHRTPPAYLYA